MRIKLLAASALAGVLLLPSVGSAFAGGPKGGSGEFKDLADAQFAQSAITMLAAQGLVNGVSQTQFDPGAPITLGQLAAILLRYLPGQSDGSELLLGPGADRAGRRLLPGHRRQ